MTPSGAFYIVYSGEKTEISFNLNPKLVEGQQRSASGPSVGGPSRAGELAAEGV